MVKIRKGFTLVELLIVVAIISIIAAIAYPSYANYLIKTNRIDVQHEMLIESQRLTNYKMAKGTYDGAKLSNGTTLKNYPESGTAYYSIDLNIAADGVTWDLEAKPIPGGKQAGNGSVILNSAGHKCWRKSSNTCTLDSSTNWDKGNSLP